MSGRHAGQQVQVVVDDGGREALARDVDHVGARKTQQHQQAEQALFVMGRADQLLQFFKIEGETRDDDDRLWGVSIEERAREQLRQTTLQFGKSRTFFGRARHRHRRGTTLWPGCCRRIGAWLWKARHSDLSRSVVARYRVHDVALARAVMLL